MEMTMRWYGKEHDTVTLEQIRQTGYVKGIISTLYNKLPGEVWELDEILALKKEVEDAGLHLAGIESVNVSDAIKTGGPDRDKDIAAYIKTLENLGKADIHLVCYNFMPVFDWTRTELDRKREDGSTVMAYNQDVIDRMDPKKMFDAIKDDMNGTVMPGWEPERMAKVQELFEMYKDIDEDKLFDNLKYFLEAIMPVCDQYNINMAIHPDDPPWDIFGLPRIYTCRENMRRIVELVDSPYNGLTLCSGSLGSSPCNDIPALVREFGGEGHIHFAHVRNIKFTGPGRFEEAAHLSGDGSLDLYEIMKAYYDVGFEGYIRPDHGRMIWDEKGRAGYGLYDRALGASYLNGLWEAIQKNNIQRNGQNGAAAV